MKIFAHRGYSKNYPENTCIAFQKAAELNIFGVEFDVHLTADQQLVVIHDETINRTSTGSGFVKDMTLAELEKYDYGRWFGAQFTGQKIPILREVLTIFAETQHVLNIEIKSDIFEYEGIEQLIAQEIEAFGMHNRVIISSFNHESIQRFHQYQPIIQTAALFASLVTNIEYYVKTIPSSAMHIWYFHGYRKIIQEAITNDMTVRAFTVNDVMMEKQLQAIGIEAIFTDDPLVMLEGL